MLLDLLKLPFRVATDVTRFWVRGVATVVCVPAVLAPLLARVLDPRTAEPAHPFLSEAWIDAATSIRESYRGRSTVSPPPMRVNQIVTDVPEATGPLLAHMDTTSGDLEMDLGHLDDVDLTVTLPFDVARSLLVDMDAQAAMHAFMSGRIKVEGDIAKLLALQTAPVDAVALEAAARIRAITT
jgi:hypothetical protein